MDQPTDFVRLVVDSLQFPRVPLSTSVKAAATCSIHNILVFLRVIKTDCESKDQN